MHTLSPSQPQNLQVDTEHDVILLRQAVRQMSRSVGLGLPKQARITAAISEIARALLLDGGTARFIIHVTYEEPHPALEIVCASAVAHAHRAHTGQNPHSLSEACTLVDEASLSVLPDGVSLILRMWLGSVSQKE